MPLSDLSILVVVLLGRDRCHELLVGVTRLYRVRLALSPLNYRPIF